MGNDQPDNNLAIIKTALILPSNKNSTRQAYEFLLLPLFTCIDTDENIF